VGSARALKLERLTQRETNRTSHFCAGCFADASADSDVSGECSVNAAVDRVMASRLVKQEKRIVELF